MVSFRTTAAIAGMCVLTSVVGACSSSGTSSSPNTGGGASSGGASTGSSGGSSAPVKVQGNTGAAVVNGGNFVLGLNADPGNLDPQASAASNLYQFSHLVYDQLLNVTNDGKIESGLAKTWKISDKNVVMQLNQNITCSDGTKFTAADAAANLNYIADPKNKSAFLGVFYPVGAKATASGDTVTVTPPKLAPFILQGLAGIPIVCASGMKNRKLLASKTLGTGPYTLTEGVPNDHYTLKKRDGYTWGPDGATTATKGLPDTITVKIIQNETTAANLLLSGGLNAAAIVGPDSQRLSASNLFSVSVPAVSGEMWFNQNSGRVGADPKVRLALTKALDLAQLAKVLTSGRGGPSTTFAAVPPVACPGNSVGSALPTHDLDAAKALLDADGWKAGSGGVRSKDGKQLAVTFVINTTQGASGSAAAELAVNTWKSLGVKVTLKPQDETAAVQTLFSTGDWDIVWEPVNVSSPDQLVGFLSGPTPAKSGQNFANIQNSAYSADVAKASAVVGAKGCSNWLAAESELVKSADVVPFANQAQQFFGKGARFEIAGELMPLTIRMTS